MTALGETTTDAFLDGRVVVRQPKDLFRSGLDAVFLAAACPLEKGETFLEGGCGAGVASLCLLARVPGAAGGVGVDIDPALTSLATHNAIANGMADRARFVCADVTAPWTALEDAGLRQEAYAHAIANPPFFVHGRSRPASSLGKARARAMAEGDLDSWLRFMAAAVAPHGTCTVIHTARALPELLRAFEGRFGDVHVLPLHPRSGEGAIRVIVRGRKGSRAPLILEAGIVLHEADGTSTAAARRILREGERL